MVDAAVGLVEVLGMTVVGSAPNEGIEVEARVGKCEVDIGAGCGGIEAFVGSIQVLGMMALGLVSNEGIVVEAMVDKCSVGAVGEG